LVSSNSSYAIYSTSSTKSSQTTIATAYHDKTEQFYKIWQNKNNFIKYDKTELFYKIWQNNNFIKYDKTTIL